MRIRLEGPVQLLLVVLLGSVAFAQVPEPSAEEKQKPKQQQKESFALEKFQGINFGLGVGVVSIPSNRLAKNVSLVNNIVRVGDQANTTASIVLESHYFFHQNAKFLGVVDNDLWGHGPFVAIRSGGTSNQIIDTIGLGYMLGFRYDKTSLSSWNIGAALSLTPSATVLGDGLTKNQPLPPGETEVRTQTKSLLGFMILASFSWNTFGQQ